jgi:hypothetical protein
VTTYIGYGFIPSGIGYMTAAVFGGAMYDLWMKDSHTPAVFWSFVVTIGLLTVLCFMVYDFWFTRTKEQRDGLPITYFNAKKAVPMAAVLLMIPVLVGSGIAIGEKTWYEIEEDDEYWYQESDWKTGPTENGYTDEGSTDTWSEEFGDKGVAKFRFSLRWTDEDDASGDHHNNPDRFKLEVETPWGDIHDVTGENTHGETETISFEIDIGETEVKKKNTNKAETAGSYTISVTCEEAGDQEYSGPPFIGDDQSDGGNQWDFEMDFTQWSRHEK